jgi:hypothetical protein
MPITKIKKKSANDKFYTKQEIAIHCIEHIKHHVSDDVIFIEPSAGAGAFSNLISCIAFDIDPETDSIVKQDFLEVEDSWIGESLCFFGNPPFGSRNKLTNAFIKKALSFSGTKYIAFVLPSVFKKRTMQRVFPSDWNLIETIDLPRNSFTLNAAEYHVPCIFQIWERNSSSIDLREVKQPRECTDFAIVHKTKADIFVFGAAPHKILRITDVSPTNRGHYLKSKIDISALCDRISSVDWKACATSSVNGGVAWFSSDEFVKHYVLKYGI